MAQELHELCFMYIYFRRGKVQVIRITSLRIYLPDKPRNNNSNYYIYFRKGLPWPLWDRGQELHWSCYYKAFQVCQKLFIHAQYANTFYRMQFLDEVFVILGIIKVEICFISQDRGLRLITFTATLIISDITDSECSNCFIIHCYEEMYRPTHRRDRMEHYLTLLLEVMHFAHNLQIGDN